MNRGQTKTYLKVILNLGIMLTVILLCIFLLPKVIIYFMPFIVGWIIAWIASPLVRFFERKLKIRRKAGSAFVIIAVIALVTLAGYLIGAKVVDQVMDFIAQVPQMWEGMQEDFYVVGAKLDVFYNYLPEGIKLTFDNIGENIQVYFGGLVSSMSEPTIEALSRFAKNLPTIIISIIMCLLSAYFFVAEKDYIPNKLSKIMPKALLSRFNMIKRGLARAVGGYFKAQLKIEFWMYLLLAIGLGFLKVEYAFIIAIGIAFLDLLPFLGTGAVLLPWAVIKFLSADYTMFIGLLIIWGGGQLARQLIQPKIVGDSIGMEPIPTLFLLFIGYKAAGVIGMIIAVPIGIIIVNMYEEGVFDTTLNSLKILYASVSNFRHLKDEDMEAVRKYREEENKNMESSSKASKGST